MKQSCIMRQCIAVSARKAQAGPAGLGSLLVCPAQRAAWDEGVLGGSLSSYPWLHLGSLAELPDSCVLSGGL